MAVLSIVLPSCQKNGQEQPDKTENHTTNTTEDPLDPSLVFDVPENLNPERRAFKILTYNSAVPEYAMEESGSDNVELALFNRDLFVQEYLNVDFDFDVVNGQYENRNEFVSAVENAVMGGSPWDLVSSYSFVAPALTVRNLLTDLNETPYLDTSKAWWPQYMLDVCEVNGKVYHLTGDISSNLLYYMQAILFHQQSVEANGIDIRNDLYQKVYDGEWTLEYFFELTENLSRDLTGDGWDDSDFYAIGMESATVLDSFYVALGLRLIEKDETGKLSVSSDLMSEKLLDIYNSTYEAIYTKHIMKIPSGGAPLRDGLCAFGVYTIYQMRTTLSERVTEFRVLPFPKYTAADDYRTLISNPHTQFSILADASNIPLSSAVTETMAYSSYRSVTPAIYETTMKLQYSPDQDNANMFDILRKGATSDVGTLYAMCFPLGSEPGSLFRGALQKKISVWSSYFKGNYEQTMNSVVNDLNTFYGSK